MRYGEIKQWPQWLVRVESGVVVEKRVFDAPEDVPEGWMTKDAFRDSITPQEPFQESGQEGEHEKKSARRPRKMSE